MSREFWEKLTSSTQTAPTRPPIIVQSGDTLAALGEQHGFDWRDVTIVRDGRPYPVGAGGISPSQLRPGDQIIPAGQPASDEDVEETCTNCCDRPVWMDTAEAELGTLEILGSSGSNPRIDKYLKSTDISSGYHNDDTPWCSAFANWVFENTQNPKTGANYTGSNSAGSQVWMQWGEQTEAFVGALLVIRWNPNKVAGHNSFIVGETPDGNYWWGLGGNQGIANDGSDAGLAVNVARYRKNSTIRSIRKPTGFDPCERYKEIPKLTADQVMRLFGKESGSAQDYNSTR